MSTYRCEISVTESTYRGDRDERLVLCTVAEEDETEQGAIEAALRMLDSVRGVRDQMRKERAEGSF